MPESVIILRSWVQVPEISVSFFYPLYFFFTRPDPTHCPAHRPPGHNEPKWPSLARSRAVPCTAPRRLVRIWSNDMPPPSPSTPPQCLFISVISLCLGLIYTHYSSPAARRHGGAARAALYRYRYSISTPRRLLRRPYTRHCCASFMRV